MNLVPLEDKYLRDLFHIVSEYEPGGSSLSYDMVAFTFRNQEGFVIVNDDKVIGYLTLSHITPLCDAILHNVVKTEYRGKWMTRDIIKKIFDFIFNTLELQRVSSFSIIGITDEVDNVLEKLGFVQEGIKRNIHKLNGNYYDVKLYGMLRSECKWI